MRISVFGLGYVGVVSAGCFAKLGFTVIGVDPFTTKVELVNQGKTPIIEQDIGEVLEDAVNQGLLRATTSASEAIQQTDLSLICVGTPSQNNGSLDLKYVRHVCEEIGFALKHKDAFHVVVMRSTMLPGTMREIVIPMLEEYSNKKAGVDFGVCINPEFLREGTAVYDFFNPPKTVIGEVDSRSGDILASLYQSIDAPLVRTNVQTAEMVKYTDNVWHALKVGFANEIGTICKSLQIDGHAVMDIFCKDTKLNLSPYYLKPGFAFGGSCLPKDVRALVYRGKSLDLELPIINSIMPSNTVQIKRALDMITAAGHRKIGFLGLSFKAGTDDLRESPTVELVETLLGKGYDIRIFDKNVHLASIVGANRDYILNKVPHISNLLEPDLSQVVNFADTIAVCTGDETYQSIAPTQLAGKQLIDLVRINALNQPNTHYHGICW